MANPIDKLFKAKDKKRKNEKTIKQQELDLLKQTVTIGVVGEIIGIYFSLMYAAVSYDNPTHSASDLLSEVMDKFTSDPTYCFPVAWSCLGQPLALWTAVIFIALAWYFIMQRNYIGTKDLGSSRFVSPYDLTEELAEPLGEEGHNSWANYIYGQNTYIAKNSTYTDKKGKRHEGLHSNNCLLIAETGGGKTFNFVKPNLLQMNCSYIMTDPSGSTKQEIGETMYRFGYNVRSLDIITMANCNQYNPMKYIKDEADIKNLVEAFITAMKKEGEQGSAQDPFWDNAMNAFLCCCIALLIDYGDNPNIMDGRIYTRCFASLTELTRMATAGMDEKFNNDTDYQEFCHNSINEKKPNALGHIFNNIRKETEKKGLPAPYCLKEYDNFKLAPEKTMSSILITAAEKLDAFNIAKVKNLTSEDTMNLNTFGENRDLIFISTPQTADGKPYMFLASFFYTQIFSACFYRGNYEMDGSHSIKMKYGEHVKWFKKDVPKEEVEKYLEGLKQVRIQPIASHYDKNDIYYAIVDKDFDSEKAGTLGGSDDDDAYRRFIRYVEEHTISRRPTLELAEKYVEDLKSAYIKTHHGEANPTTCRFMIDEFANIGEIPDFLKLLATVRKYNIVIDIILQSREQLKRMYEKSYSEVEDNCPITLFLGGAGVETTKSISEKIGKETVVVNNVNTDNKKASSGHNAQQRDLMDSAEVGRLDMTDEIIMLAHYQPCIDKKYNTTSHPMWKYTRDYIEKQQGKEKFMMYDTARFPDMKKDVPLFIEVGEHSDNITHIGVFTEQACMEAIGKFGTELENAVQGDINDFFNTVTEDDGE